jgi:hypothetical protein
MVVHDLNQAARHAHHLIALSAGRVMAAGPPAEVITPDLIRRVFRVEAEVVADPRTGAPLCIPYGRASGEPSVREDEGRAADRDGNTEISPSLTNSLGYTTVTRQGRRISASASPPEAPRREGG